MHIAYVTETYPPEVNGVALTVARTVAYLRARGHAVDLVRPAQSGERAGADADQWLSPGCPIPMYAEMRFGWASPAALARRFQAKDAAFVHVATEGPLGWAAIRAARRLGLPVTSDFRTNFHQYSRYYGVGWLEPLVSGYLRRFHNRTRRTFVPTGETRRELLRAGFERVEVVGRGVDLDRFNPAHRSASLRCAWQAGDGPILLYVGRLAAEKGVELALRAFREAQRQVPTARMVVVGGGPLRAALERSHPDVTFVGPQTGAALAQHYASADLFLFPSQTETFGNVTLEALASGLPVIAFGMAAALEYVRDHVDGRLVPPGDEAGFVTATASMATLHRELDPMRRAARASVAACGWDVVLQGFERRLLDASGSERSHSAAWAG